MGSNKAGVIQRSTGISVILLSTLFLVSCAAGTSSISGASVDTYDPDDPVIRIQEDSSATGPLQFVIRSAQRVGGSTLGSGRVQAREGERVVICNHTSRDAFIVFGDDYGEENYPGPFSNRRPLWWDIVRRVVIVDSSEGSGENCRSFKASNKSESGYDYSVVMVGEGNTILAVPDPPLPSAEDVPIEPLTVRPKIVVAG